MRTLPLPWLLACGGCPIQEVILYKRERRENIDVSCINKLLETANGDSFRHVHSDESPGGVDSRGSSVSKSQLHPRITSHLITKTIKG